MQELLTLPQQLPQAFNSNFLILGKYGNRIAIKQDGKYGFINTSGYFLTPIMYDWIWNSDEEMAIVQRKISIDKELCKKEYESMCDEIKDMFELNKTSQQITLNEYGIKTVEKQDISHHTMYYNEYLKKNNCAPEIIDEFGTKIFNFEQYLIYFGNTLKYGYVNENGKEIIPCIFDDAKGFSQDLAPVKVKLKWGYINKSGEMVIRPMLDEAYSFSEGYAVVKMRGKYAYINKKGTLATDFIYIQAESVKDKKAKATKQNGQVELIEF